MRGQKERVLNSVFISIGVAIILVLVTALVAPFFIDWTVYRSTFETYAEEALGHKVTVLGEADMTLLPSPTVTFTDVRVGGSEDPLLVVSRFQLRLDLPPLLKGEFHVLDMSLDRPHLTLSLDEEGRPDWLTAMRARGAISEVKAEDVTFENITISDGAVTVVDARSGRTHTLDNADLVVQARSLAGPFRIDGPMVIGDERYTVSLATGKRLPDGSLRIKGGVTPDRYSIAASFDGNFTTTDGLPRFDGDFQLKGIEQGDDGPQELWTAEGAFAADTARLVVSKADYHFGPQDRRSSMSGQMQMTYAGDRRFDVVARAKQIDLDRLYGGGPQAPVALDDAATRVLEVLKGLPVPDMAGTLALDMPVVVAGGELLQDVRLDLETRSGGWRISRLAGRVPGRTTIATEGDLTLGDRFAYRGSLSVVSEQPGAFAAWLGEGDGGSSKIQPVSLEGRVNVVDSGAAIENLRVELGDAAITGGVSYRTSRQDRDEFGLSLVADVLDVDQVEELLGLLAPAAGGESFWSRTNLSLMLRAREARLRGVQGKDLSLQASFEGDHLQIDRLYTADLAGAEVDVSGRVDDLAGAPVGNLSARLNATDLDGLVGLLRAAFPQSPALARLERAADYLVPARFEGSFVGKASGDGSRLDLSLSGSAGGVETSVTGRFEGRVDAWHEADVDLDVALKGPDGGQILRQLGLDILPVDELGQGDLHLQASGRPDDGLEVSLAATAPAASLTADGRLRLQRDEPVNYSLTGALSMEDLGPFALLVGRVMPVMSGEIPVDLTYALDGKGSDLALRDLAGQVGDVSVSGSVEGSLDPAPGERLRRFKGALRLSDLDLQALSEAVLGPDQWSSLGSGRSVWPAAPFGQALLSSLDLALDIEAERMDLGLAEAAENISARLRLGPEELRLDDLASTFAGGRLGGQLALRRSGGEGAFSGRMKLEGADLTQLVWTPDGRAVATGTLDLLADVEGAGRSISGIVASLTGSGTVTIREGALRGLNPQAFSLVMRAVDAGLDLSEDRIGEVFLSHMQAGTLRFDTLEAALGVIGGRVSARNIAVDAQAANLFGSAQINLNDLTLDSDFSLTVDAGDEAVVGGEPQVGLLFTGPLEQPERKVNVAPFTAYLTLRAFEQEVERVEKLQSEILENQKLSRELKREAQERARREREAEEAARAAEEAAARAAEEPAPETEPQPDPAPAEPAPTEPEPAPVEPPAQQATPAPISAPENPADFAARIRQVLQAPAETTGAVVEEKKSGQSVLKPLAPPQTVEDLLAREIGLPADVLNRARGFDTGAPAGQ